MTPQISPNSKYLIDVLKAVLEGHTAPMPPDGVDLGTVYSAAAVHALVPMMYHGLYPLGLGDEAISPFYAAHRRNMQLSVRQELEFNRISEALERNGIDYCPLKGFYTRELYPEPSMRVMGDIDILVHKKDHEASYRTMLELGYKCVRFDISDDDKYSLGDVHIEFHTGLDSDGLKNRSFYDDPWKFTIPVSGLRRRLRTSDEYLYSAAHALKHFMNFGAGLRFLIDTYLYLTRAELDRAYINAAAEKMGITRFLSVIERTAMAVFGDGEFDEETSIIFRFMLENGIGGNSTNYETSLMVKASAGKTHISWGRFYLRAAFPTVKSMKQREPVLKRMPWLLPFMYVKRWFSLAFNRRDHVNERLERINSISSSDYEKLKRIHEIAGINND